MNSPQEYLGDGVYASFDGYQVWLATQEGHRIALEPPVLHALDRYRQRVYAQPPATTVAQGAVTE
jgi:hypothetical protein